MSDSYVYVIAKPPTKTSEGIEVCTSNVPLSVEVRLNGESAIVSAAMLKNAIDAADQNYGNRHTDGDQLS